MNTLKCSKCQQEKLTDEFYTRKGSRRGFTSHCKICRNFIQNEKASIKRGSKRRGAKYSVNQNCFNDDSLECWYMGGLIAADGSIYQSIKSESTPLLNGVSLTLKRDDLVTVQRFKDFCQYSGPIAWYKGEYPCCRINGVPIILEALRKKIQYNSQKKFNSSPSRLLSVFGPRFSLYYGLY